MLKILPGSVRGILSLLFYTLNTFFWGIPIFILTVIKMLIPIKSVKKQCSRMLNGCACYWIGVNTLNQSIFSPVKWDVSGTENLKKDDWYMVLANHQSWVDILVLQRIFHRKIPFLKFFLKKELIWFPLLGQIWWALDFPFMKRYTKSYLKKNPHKMGKDIEITRKACKKFQTIPVSIMSFVEGTRFTKEKHARQRSPYDNLLRTKAGGIAFVLGAMGSQLSRVLDVTIVYPNGKKTFWQFLCGQVDEIRVRVASYPVTEEILGDYTSDVQYRKKFQAWLNRLWFEKDEKINNLLLS